LCNWYAAIKNILPIVQFWWSSCPQI
jgi:hypothetical protein